VTLVHGRIPAEERARRVHAFRTGEARLLVGTTIVEVGVDVPEATVMVIDGAERFGLAQLHQLRGRVGRGTRSGWCLLLAPAADVPRLSFLEGTRDGFAIAEEDLRTRGRGDLAGRRQAGGAAEGLVDPAVDEELVLLARRLVAADPSLVALYAARDARPPAIV
jgi:ATP-dependent DNA helicase RecG